MIAVGLLASTAAAVTVREHQAAATARRLPPVIADAMGALLTSPAAVPTSSRRQLDHELTKAISRTSTWHRRRRLIELQSCWRSTSGVRSARQHLAVVDGGAEGPLDPRQRASARRGVAIAAELTREVA